MKALQVRIRRVRQGDIDRIVDIERSWHHLSHWSIDSYYRLLSDNSFTSSFVAEMEPDFGRPKIVGFVIFHITLDVSEIYNIAVEAEHAHSGIGTQLMRAAIDESRHRNARRVMLEVRKSNTPAIKFYLGFRFRIAGERKNYYSNPIEDAYVMELPVNLNLDDSD
jgi:ribosomal-protein-alanine N-acetyltransferase